MSAPSLISANSDRIPMGIAAMIAAMACMTGLDAFAKWLGEGYPIFEIMFFRNFFGMAVVAVLLYRAGGMKAMRTAHPVANLLRACCALSAGFCFFTGLRYLGLAEAMAIAFVAPLIATALSVPILKERVGWHRWGAVLLGFVGTLIALQPGSSAFHWAAILPVGAAVSYATLMILTRYASRQDGNATLLFYTTAPSLLVTSLIMPFVWVTPNLQDLFFFACMGLMGSGGAFFMILGYRYAPAAVASPFEYSALIWGLLIGWLVWQELPPSHVWWGAALLVLAGLYILHREARVARTIKSRPKPQV